MEGLTGLSVAPPDRETLESAVVRFAGDSGDGMQLTGGQFTLATALSGNDLATFPDFPAEIRAPAGTTFGVSAFQINFGARVIKTAGDVLDALVAMNPAALKVNVEDLHPGGLIIADTGSFNDRNLAKAGFDGNPLTDGSLHAYRLMTLDVTKLTQDAVADCGVSKKEAVRAKNMYALGLVLWLFGRDRDATIEWLSAKFASKPNILAANLAALDAGHAFGETAELPQGVHAYSVPRASNLPPGVYRNVTGNEALAWGLAAGAQLAGLEMTFCSYPITPASQLLHALSRMPDQGVTTFQAEDEIAAVCAAIGASYAGNLGVTSSSGPGVALKTEAIGLAISAELPLIVVNAQRGGPSTGLPTKTEQSDLFQSVWGRNGDAPLCVIAARSSGDCFDVAVEAVRISTESMVPVILLTDGYMQNASEPWRIPNTRDYSPFPVEHRTDPEGFQPFDRDPETLARPWARPGTPGLSHRIGGLEREDGSGNVSYDPANHQKMTDLRAEKVARIADRFAPQKIEAGPDTGPIAVVGWGSTYGPISRAVADLLAEGLPVAHIHLRHIWPLPKDLGAMLARYDQILVPEMNHGQLVKLLRAELLVPAEGLNKVSGKPFKIAEIEQEIRNRIGTDKNGTDAP